MMIITTLAAETAIVKTKILAKIKNQDMLLLLLKKTVQKTIR